MTAPKKENHNCIFCVAAACPDMDKTLTVHRNDSVVVMLNRYPYTNGHLMVAPVDHKALLYDTSADVLLGLIRAAADAQRILADTYRPQGFNIGMNFGEVAGAGIADHYHMHIVPRWGGDHNFMSVTGATRLVPEALETTFSKLKPRFEQIASSSHP
ncbi:MAG TPA: HIT domain-containing protein [Thermoanaerobaculia bacterium]|nr:HIT domain-containing protein [Thermoanaerobaculia bacterium]